MKNEGNDFVQALEWLKAGCAVRRKRWVNNIFYALKFDSSGRLRWMHKDGSFQANNIAFSRESMTESFDWEIFEC